MTQWLKGVLVLAIAAGTGLTLLAALPAPAGADPGEPKLWAAKEHPQEGSKEFRIATVSTRNDMVSGGDVLVRIDVSPRVRLDRVVVELNDADVTGAFRADAASRSLLGLVSGLRLGNHRLVAREAGPKGPRAALQITNYPISGPIFSGRHEQPFFCQTHMFQLPVIGGNLGPALDADCSIDTRVDHVYKSTSGAMRPLNVAGGLPADVAMTTTTDGVTVRYIVRMETGTINRAIYQTAILNDPFSEPAPDPWTPPAGWNRKLIYQHGGGCQSGWYVQGATTGGVLHDALVGRGYARATSTLNTFGNNCNDLLASETTVMVKERFIEAYGVPKFTIGTGGSGGSYQSHQTADNYPGIFDGIIVTASFPDVTSATIFTVADARLLDTYFRTLAPGLFTQEQQRGVSGFGQWGSIPRLSDGGTSARRLDPDADFQSVVPLEARYNAVTNPGGARGDVYDHTVNVYGRNPVTGFARRPLDNEGVQYGLAALNNGVITKDQFLDLNERIGGFDIDLNPIPQRHAADRHATRMAYRAGRILNGGLGLAATPIIDYRTYTDDRPQGDIHMISHQFSTRARLVRANGHADNHVMLVGGRFGFTPESPDLGDAWNAMDRWLTAVQVDASSDPLSVKVVRNKPADLVDACWTPDHVKIEEPQIYHNADECNALYLRFSTPRQVAGAPLENDIVKCRLKEIDPADYQVVFTPEERARLDAIFSTGVCDWSKKGAEQHPPQGTWLTFGAGEDGDDD